MKKKSLWRAKLMARMAKDGDVEGLAEIITEMMEEPAPAAVVLPAETAALPAADPLVSAVAGAVAENLEAASADEDLPGAPAAAEAPVIVETPTEQPVIVDCGPEILELLRQIVGLLSGPAADCGPENRSAGPAADSDEDPAAEIEAAAETAVEQMAETAAQAAAEAVTGAAQALESTDPGALADPVEELVAEILEGEAEEAAEAAGDEEEIFSSVLEPEAEEDEDPETPEENSLAADALRAALASFRPQLRRMSPKQRQRFNADVAARMKKLSARPAAGKPSPYAALRKSASRDQSARSLGQKIMASRNANLRGPRA